MHQLAPLPNLRLFVLFLGYGFGILIGLLPKLWLRFTALLGAKLLSLSVDIFVGFDLVQLFPSSSIQFGKPNNKLQYLTILLPKMGIHHPQRVGLGRFMVY